MTVIRQRISVTKIVSFGRCPYQLYLAEVLPKPPPSYQFIRGRAVHDATRLFWRAKQNGVVLAPERLREHVRRQSERVREAEGLWVAPGENPDEIWAKCLETGAAIAERLAKYLAEAPMPRLVEEPMAAEVGDVAVTGRLDCLEGDTILDLKSGERARTARDVATDIQLTGYVMLAKAAGLIRPAGRYRVKIVSITPKKVATVESHRTEADLEAFARRAVAVGKAMAAGIYPPASDGWWHSPQFCPYWNDCEFAGGAS